MLLKPAVKERSMRMVDSLRAGSADVHAHAVQIEVLMDIADMHGKGEEKQPEHISEEHLKPFFDQWEAWDAFLVYLFSTLSTEPLSSDDQQLLLETLLETRHRFIAGLTDRNFESDFVREQFVAAWTKLSPVFRNHLADRPSAALLDYLAFFTAADALCALDKIGPVLDIDISRNGLIRMARLFGEVDSDVLAYRGGLHLQLREVLGLGPPPEASGPAFDMDEIELDSVDPRNSGVDQNSLSAAIGALFCKSAWANQKKSKNTLAEIKTWLVSRDNLETYMGRIRALLKDAARATLQKRETSVDYNQFFPTVVLSTAWQESCFRQFLVKRKKIVYLRSYDGSSVGLMQINERVWRGLYDPHHLRWDIRYNALAGCEIIDLYVTKYLTRHAKRLKAMSTATGDAYAGIIYAMYNGGPGQLDKFLIRSAEGKLHQSDRLFSEKYAWVKNGQLDNISKCLIGK